MADISQQSVEEFNDYLKEFDFPGEVLDAFLMNDISGSIFLLMEEEELKELVPSTGQRIKMRELLRKQKKVPAIIATIHVVSYQTPFFFF